MLAVYRRIVAFMLQSKWIVIYAFFFAVVPFLRVYHLQKITKISIEPLASNNVVNIFIFSQSIGLEVIQKNVALL